MLRLGCALAALVLATPALAQQEREFCADRPGLGTPPCTLAPGRAMIEFGAATWERSSDALTVADEVSLADMLLRVGVSETTEVQLGLTGHVIQRSRDRASGAVDRMAGIGDGTFSIRQSLSGPDGPVAIQGFVTAPLARGSDWGGGVLLAASFNLPAGFGFDLNPQVEVVANESGPGHHLAWGGVAGLTHDLGSQLSATAEIAAFRDDDPDGHSTDARVAASLAWQVVDHMQLDIEADAGLTAGAPDHLLAIGLVWQFR